MAQREPAELTAPEPRGPIRVLHVITRLVVGGAQENTLLTATHLDRARYAVALASGPTDGPEGSLEERAHGLSLPFFRISHLVRPLHPARDILAFFQLYALIRRHHYDIVHTHTTKAGLLGRLAARAAGVPIVIHTPHGHAFHGYFGTVGSRLLVAVERVMAHLTDRIVCLTQAEKEDYIQLGVGRSAQLVMIHSGVDLEGFQTIRVDVTAKRRELNLPLEGPLIGCVARLVSVKGVDVLLEAVPQIRAAMPTVTVVFVGGGPLRARLEQRTSLLGLDSSVSFLGVRRDVPEIMGLFDVVVLPSRNEGMGRAAVEAMAAGRPVVASRVAGIQNVVEDGQTGVLVTPENSEELARAVISLLGNPALCAAMGNSGRTRAAEYGIPAMVDQISNLYETLVKQKIGMQALSDLQNVDTV